MNNGNKQPANLGFTVPQLHCYFPFIQKRSIESNQSAQSQDVESDESETSFDGGDITSESSQQGHTTLRARNSDGSNTLSTQQLITSDDKE